MAPVSSGSREKDLVNWPAPREILDYRVVGSYLSFSLSSDLELGNSQAPSFLEAPRVCQAPSLDTKKEASSDTFDHS